MVVSIDSLNCFDYLIWLRTGANTARRLCLSQPSVSRNVSRVSKAFGVALSKSHGEWAIEGDTTLLNQERTVHQRYRWSRNLPLRIEAQQCSGPFFCDQLPRGWHKGNFDFLEVHTPLSHLRDRVIDAWIGSFPDIPSDDDRIFKGFHLTRYPVALVVHRGHPLLALGHAMDLEDVRRYHSMALPDKAFPRFQAALQELGLWNPPLNIQCHRDNWQEMALDKLAVGYATCFTLHLFDGDLVVLPIPIPLEVGDTLIVRREFAEHTRLVELVAYLKRKALMLAEQFAEVRIPESPS